MNTLTLQTVINNYVTKVDEDQALRQSFLDHKAQLDSRRSYLYSQLRPGQGDTKAIIDQQYTHSLEQFAADNSVIERLFPQIDMSFLTEATGNFPLWAIYDANKVEPFRIRYSTYIDFRKPWGGGTIEVDASASAFVLPTQFADLFYKSRSPSYADGLYVTLNNYAFHEALKIKLTPEMNCNISTRIQYRVPFGTELFEQLVDRKLDSATRQIELEFTATFHHFVPEPVNETINDFGLLFDQLLFIAEVPDWHASKITIIPASDPLLIGRRGKEYRLLDAFDVTDAEEYIKQKFSF